MLTHKIFFWLLLRNRLWCNDRLQRRGWPNGYFCPLCMHNLESSVHLVWDCPIDGQVWITVATWVGCATLHGRCCRRVTEEGNGHVGPTRRESWGGLGRDGVGGSSYGLGYDNQVKRSTGQTPSGESQRARPDGRLCQG